MLCAAPSAGTQSPSHQLHFPMALRHHGLTCLPLLAHHAHAPAVLCPQPSGPHAAGCCPTFPTRQLCDCGEGAGSQGRPPAASPPALAQAMGQHPGETPAHMTPDCQKGGRGPREMRACCRPPFHRTPCCQLHAPLHAVPHNPAPDCAAQFSFTTRPSDSLALFSKGCPLMCCISVSCSPRFD